MNENIKDEEAKKRLANTLDALREIAKGEGRYNMDQLKHASNTIEDMKGLALLAIKENNE